MRLVSTCLATALLVSCGGGSSAPGSQFLFELTADLDDSLHFYDQPWPLDTRLDATGHRNLKGLPHSANNAKIELLIGVDEQATAFPVIPVAYFRSTVALAPRDSETVIEAAKGSPIFLVDIDAGAEHARLIPSVAQTLDKDDYAPDFMLAVAPRPGFVLAPHRRYAFVVMRNVNDANGKALQQSPTIKTLLAGKTAPNNAVLATLFAPLVTTLKELGIANDDVAIATVFTTNDVVGDLAAIGDDVLSRYSITVDNLQVDPDDGATHPRYCELRGTITMPQFQAGTQPFDTGGNFVFDAAGKLVKQSDLPNVPVTVTLPKTKMPDGGFPLIMYFHGSGGLSTAPADRGTWKPLVNGDASACPQAPDEWNGVMGCNTKGEGPAYVVAEHGFGMVGAALPVNPERLPGASETAYINLNNLAAGRDLFRQGVLEQRLLLDAMLKLQIDPATVASCAGLELPTGATTFHYDPKQVYAQGQSMGGQYTNLYGATEKRVLGVVPTGAGGFWSYFILNTTLIPNAAAAIGTLVIQTTVTLSFMHPGMHVFEQAWEPVEPMVYMPRLAVRPLDGHPIRPIYEPVGLGDSYFPTVVYDAMALAYGNRQTGDEIWPTLQPALALDGRSGFASYPVANECMSGAAPYTGVVVQYNGDGVYDPHALYSQLDSVKYQYGCFLSTLSTTGIATVPPIRPLGTPCLP